MSMYLRRLLAYALALLLISTAGIMPTGWAEEADEAEALPAVGDVISGFTVESILPSEMLQSDIITFTHEHSGAQLVYIKNDDPEMNFSIAFHTPQLDETNINFMLASAMLSSSEKYPGFDVFRDMIGKTYNTYVNGTTYTSFTTFDLGSRSEEQLLNMIDVYLSIIAAPSVLENENIFKSVGLRYELDDPEGEITLAGSTYTRNLGEMCSTSNNAYRNTLHALFPDQYASYQAGYSHLFYKDITYELALETYDLLFNFDNSVLMLYGDLDYEKFLEFIDSEYLSKAERSDTDLSEYRDAPSEPGYTEVTMSMPAYEGDSVEDSSIIMYAFSLEDASAEELILWDLFTEMLYNGDQICRKMLNEQGISNSVSTYTITTVEKPLLYFKLFNANPEQAQPFKQAILNTFEHVAEYGFDEETVNTVLKQKQADSYLSRNSSNAGINLFPDIANDWCKTGETNYYEVYEQTLAKITQDKDQELFRQLASEALSAARSVLVTSSPEPGLAEEIIAERDAYLAEMKAGMTDAEIEQLVQETLELEEWNQQSEAPADYTIDPQSIPDIELFKDIEKVETNGAEYYLVPADASNVGNFYLGADLSNFSEDELYDFLLYRLIIGDIATQEHTAEETTALKTEYLYKADVYYSSYIDDDGKYTPAYALRWTGLLEDFEPTLEYLLEIWKEADFSDTEQLLSVIKRYEGSYNLAQDVFNDFLDTSWLLAASYSIPQAIFNEMCNSQDFYYYLQDIEQQLLEDEAFGAELAERLNAMSEKMASRDSIVFIAVAPEEALDGIYETAEQLISALPAGESGDFKLEPEGGARDIALAVESSEQNTYIVGNFYAQEDFLGRYIPFLAAANAKYLLPNLRVQQGASTVGFGYSVFEGDISMYIVNHPGAASVLEVYDGLADYIENMELTQDELDDFIISCLSDYGNSEGVLNEPMYAIRSYLGGCDLQKAEDFVNDIKQATLEDQQAAADAIRELLANSTRVTIGNEAVLEQDKDAYDLFISYRSDGE